MTLMGCAPTNVSTELVPRMNIRAMMGAEMMTDCPMVRDALRHSPARMATYSKPLSAPTHIWPNTARLKQFILGHSHGMGSKRGMEPRAQRPNGQRQQDRVGQQDHDAAGIVQPLADIEAAHGDVA